MEDKELLDYLREYKDLMQETLDRVDAMEDVLYNKILKPAESLQSEYETGERRKAFGEKYGERLSAYNDDLRAIEGDDFDLNEVAFKEIDGKEDQDALIDALLDKVEKQLQKVRDRFGVKDSDHIAEKQTEADAKADDSPTDKPDAKAEEEKHEEPADAPEDEAELEKAEKVAEAEEKADLDEPAEDVEVEVIDSPEEIESFIKELEDEKRRLQQEH